MTATKRQQPKLGLALGGGAARGWAHLGVIKALHEAGIRPDLVCGTSIGALVGAVYVHGQYDVLVEWVRKLGRREMVGLLDLALPRGGVFEGKRLMENYIKTYGDPDIEDLPLPFGAVATDLERGIEVWLREGKASRAVRASISLPGIFTPVKYDGRWLVDGGLVNPVPVSLCRAMGAEIVLAVNLNGDIVGRHLRHLARDEEPEHANWMEWLSGGMKDPSGSLKNQLASRRSGVPGMFDVLASSVNIMQDRLTRSRMAGDPPDLLLNPRVAHIPLLEFDRGDEAMAEGYRVMNESMPTIKRLLRREDA